MKKILFILLVGATLSGCASIIDGRTQNVTLLPSRGQEVPATVITKAGTQDVKLPQSVSVQKGNQDIAINVKRTNCVNESTTISKAKLNPWFWGNILFLYGSTTDAVTGAMWSYDDTVTVAVNEKDNCSK